MITIHYKKKFGFINLISGIIWLLFAILQVTMSENPIWLSCFWFLLPAFYLMVYYNQSTKNYLTIDDGIIKQNWLFGKQMKLNDILKISHHSGEYILISSTKKMKIQIEVIHEDSLSALQKALKSLHVVWV